MATAAEIKEEREHLACPHGLGTTGRDCSARAALAWGEARGRKP